MTTTVTDFDFLSGEIITREFEMADTEGLNVGDDVRAVARIEANFNGTIRVIKAGTVGRVVLFEGATFVVRFIVKGGVMDVRDAATQVVRISSPANRKII